MDFLNLLAQQSQPGAQPGLLGIIDQVARTPLSTVVLGVAVLTAVRIALHLTILKPQPVQYRPSSYKFGTLLNEFCDALIYAGVFVFLVIRPFVLQTFYIPSGSMVNTLLVRDYIVANKMVYRVSDPKPGDIAVFKPPQAAKEDKDADTDYIKRVIGTPGDLVEVKNRVLYRNGKRIEEPYVVYTTPVEGSNNLRFNIKSAAEVVDSDCPDFKLVKYKDRLIPLTVFGENVNSFSALEFRESDPSVQSMLRSLPAEKVPAGYYLMMGDNRNGSFDSRYWGLVPRDSIIGRAEFIWMPFNRIGKVR